MQKRNGNREEHRQKAREHCQRRKREVIDHYGGKCACCGESAIEFLCLDHKNGNGQQERKAYHFTQVWRIAIKRGFPDDYQVLCFNCNNAKSIYGICPHQTQLTYSRTSLPARV